MNANEPPFLVPRWTIVALCAITLIGLVLRLVNVRESLWLDELHTGWVVKDGWSEVAWRAQIGNQSPLWFYAVKVVTSLGGESELTLRLLSLIAGTALIPVAFWLVRVSVFTRDQNVHRACVLAALLASALVALDPNCIFYATEARPYACLQLCAAMQFGLFVQILQQPTTRLRIGWMLLTALAFHLHYTGILILLGECTVLLFYYLLSRKPVPYRPWRAMFDWQIAAMLCLPAIGHVLEVGRRREMWNSMSEIPGFAELFKLFPLSATVVVGLFACGFVGVSWFRNRQISKPPARWTPLLVVALWFFVPLLAAFAALAATHFELNPVYIRRYLMAVAIGPMLLTALFVAHVPSIRWQWLLAICALGYGVYESNMVQQICEDGRTIPSRGEDWRGAVAWLAKEHAQHPQLVLVDAGLVEDSSGFPVVILIAGKEKIKSVVERQLQYRAFPLRSAYAFSIDRRDVLPLSLYPEWRWLQDDPYDFHPEEFWLIARHQTTDDIANHYRRTHDRHQVRWYSVMQSRDFSGVSVQRLRLSYLDAEITSPPSPQSPPSAP
jgi:hypothetical protein